MSDSVRPHRQQPTRLLCPWDSPDKNTGVGCHFLLQCMKVKSESEFAQSCPTLSDPMDCSLPGSSVHGIFQARVLEWGAITFSAAWFLLVPKYSVTQEQRTCVWEVTKCLPFLILAITVLSCQVLKHGVIISILLITNLYWTLTMCQELDWVQHTL